MKLLLSIICLLLMPVSVMAGTTTGTVRVAAIQCPSVMGRTADNLNNITNLVRQAASRGARIVVLPECAVQGYLDQTTWTSWSSSETGATDVRKVAETVPGPSTMLLSGLAKELGIYLCAGLVESASNVFYNSQVLLDPHGVIIAHHRKKALWTPGDSTWCTAGDLPVQVVDTEYGRIGMMICFDFHVLPPLLAKGGADIVLYSVGWYGPNEENWFGKVFPEKSVIPYGFDVVAANWTSPTESDRWPGRGHSCIITREGKVLAMSRAVCGNDIVFGDLDIRKQNKQMPVDATSPRQLTLKRMKAIVIDQVEFRQANLSDVLDFIENRSRDSVSRVEHPVVLRLCLPGSTNLPSKVQGEPHAIEAWPDTKGMELTFSGRGISLYHLMNIVCKISDLKWFIDENGQIRIRAKDCIHSCSEERQVVER